MMDVFQYADPAVLIVVKLFYVLVCFGGLVALWHYALIEWGRRINSWKRDRRRLVVLVWALVLLTAAIGFMAVRELYQAAAIAFSGGPWI